MFCWYYLTSSYTVHLQFLTSFRVECSLLRITIVVEYQNDILNIGYVPIFIISFWFTLSPDLTKAVEFVINRVGGFSLNSKQSNSSASRTDVVILRKYLPTLLLVMVRVGEQVERNWSLFDHSIGAVSTYKPQLYNTTRTQLDLEQQNSLLPSHNFCSSENPEGVWVRTVQNGAHVSIGVFKIPG